MEDKVEKKRKNYTIIEENGKKRKVVDIVCCFLFLDLHVSTSSSANSSTSCRTTWPFSRLTSLNVCQPSCRLQPANPHLDDWSVKGKFPAELKPVLAEVALKAIELGEYDDDFFNLMPTLFPYNRFTMMVCFYSLITFIRLVLTLW